MANYYTHFSMGLDLTPDESTWCARLLGLVADIQLDFSGIGVDTDETDVLAILIELETKHGFGPDIRSTPFIGASFDENFSMFDFQVDGPDLWCYTEGGGSVEALAAFLESFLKRWRPKDGIGFSWADSCSKPHVNSFSGGACWVTVEETHWLTATDWLAKRRGQHYDSPKG